ncbi:hypothetical protein N752_07235 [Desulforamulus aquiferis]|nr:hypothetical protein N752_07235 [Desulforamulus aquiferis]
MIVIVPVFTQCIVNGKTEEARRVFSTLFSIFLIFLTSIIVIGLWNSNFVISLFAPGFDQQTAQLASNLALIMFPSILFFALASFFAGLLNTHNIFAPSAAAPVILNTVIIGSSYTIGKSFGVYGLAIGVLLGTLIMAFFQAPFLRKTDFNFRAVLDLKDEGVRRVFGLMFPILIGSGVGQINILIYYHLGSELVEGTISALNYATKLILLPQGIFVMAVATAIFPSLSRSVVDLKYEQFSNTLIKGLKMILLLSAPCVVGLIVLREPIVSVLFKRGAFDERALALTSGVLLFLSLGLIGQCLSPVLTRGFYALQDTLSPVKVTFITVTVNIALSLLLIKRMEHLGLALANSVAMTINAVLLGFLLRKRVTSNINNGLVVFSCKVVLSSVVMGVLLSIFDKFLVSICLSIVIRLLIDIAIGGTIFFVIGLILRTEELYYATISIKDILKTLSMNVLNKTYCLKKYAK